MKEVEFSEWMPRHKVGYLGSLFGSRGRVGGHWENLPGAVAGAWELSPEGSPEGSRKRPPGARGGPQVSDSLDLGAQSRGGGEMAEGTTGKSNTFQRGFLLRPL